MTGVPSARGGRVETVFGPQSFDRKPGEALHPEREPPEMLEQIRRPLGRGFRTRWRNGSAFPFICDNVLYRIHLRGIRAAAREGEG